MDNWLAILASRLHGLLRSHRLDADFDTEMAAHLDLLTDDHIRRRLAPDEARRQAILRFGGTEQFTASGSGAGDVFLTGFGEPQGLKALGVSGNLFQVLGAAPLLGRTFAEEEQWEGRSRVAILSYGLWQSAFGGDPAIVGRTITLS